MRTFWLLIALLPFTVAAAPAVTVLRIDGAITPATAEYVTAGLAHAAQHDSALVVLEMDTPGGLDTSMRSIIKAILASPVPPMPICTGVAAPRLVAGAIAATWLAYRI